MPSGQKSGAANSELNKPIVDAEFLEFANKPIVGDGENKPIMGGTFTQNLNKPIMRTHCLEENKGIMDLIFPERINRGDTGTLRGCRRPRGVAPRLITEG